MNQCVIIVAGGKGLRMGLETPKQFLKIAGKSILAHTVSKFLEYNPKIAIFIALPKDFISLFSKELEALNLLQRVRLVSGGQTRFDSVKNAMQQIEYPQGIVAIHDGVRPMVSVELIKNGFELAAIHGAAVPVIPVVSSLRKKTKDGKSIAVNREEFVEVQTPQCFQISTIKKLYQQDYQSHFTDDASVIEASGGEIHLFDGHPDNIKITHAMDYKFAELKLK